MSIRNDPRVPDSKISVEGEMLWHNTNQGVSRGLDVKACRPSPWFAISTQIMDTRMGFHCPFHDVDIYSIILLFTIMQEVLKKQ